MNLAAISVKSAWGGTIAFSLVAYALLAWTLRQEPEGTENLLTFLPLLNCILNASSAISLVLGVMEIRKGRIRQHMRWMLTAFGFSAVFLVGYLLHHYLHGDTRFPAENGLRPVYLFILASHILLSVVCLPMILMTFFLAFSRRLTEHKRLAKFTFPIWLYVSVTGVLVFVMLKAAGA